MPGQIPGIAHLLESDFTVVIHRLRSREQQNGHPVSQFLAVQIDDSLAYSLPLAVRIDCQAGKITDIAKIRKRPPEPNQPIPLVRTYIEVCMFNHLCNAAGIVNRTPESRRQE